MLESKKLVKMHITMVDDKADKEDEVGSRNR